MKTKTFNDLTEEQAREELESKIKTIKKDFREMCNLMSRLNFDERSFNEEIQKMFLYMRKYKQKEKELTETGIARMLKIRTDKVNKILSKNNLYQNRFFGRWQKDKEGKWEFLYFYERVLEICYKDVARYTGI